MMQIGDYTWIFGVGMVMAFVDAYGIGANDVANSFANSVSAGSLTLAQACVIACFTEFFGALLLGSHTTSTIKGGILSVSEFVDNPEMLMLGMLCAITGSAIWVLFASRNGWPVSTTHSIVGAIVGVGISAFGGGAITWGWTGIARIITSWFISPVIAGLVAAAIYTFTKYAVLRQVDSFKWALRLVPFYVFFTIAIEAFYIIFKGAPGLNASSLPIGVVIAISFGIATFFAAFAWFFYCPWARRRIQDKEDLRWYHCFVIPFIGKRPTLQERDPEIVSMADSQAQRTHDNVNETIDIHENKKFAEEIPESDMSEVPVAGPSGWRAKANQYKTRAVDMALHGIRKDVRNLENEDLKHIHAAAELYEDEAEYLFRSLQVFTACMASFAHGSNDVSNAIGPIAAIFDVWQTARVDVAGSVGVPAWILAYGGVAIDIGLATMGYRVMRKMGNNITYLTPCRGFCAELAAALTVLTCSKLGLPVSTTHCITGATAAIGLCNGRLNAVNWKMLGWCFFSWILTLPFAGLVAGLIFAFASNSPTF
ncbi:phosphate transporter [Radiomyces spectabilis]|uniref:phosphate transporter n=1 Tax=Radiomyces spectabilis TaxID=64574 RepID=UPI00221F683A|nr:phosphate transporter [Radiomyces spectabilis]KAI8379334.1 phosphate transporter [Radiomyces spectabilis]